VRISLLRRTLAVITLAAIVCLTAISAQAKPSGNWRITFDSRAKAEGLVSLRIAPPEGAPIEVEVKIPAGKTENQVADLVSDALKKALDSKSFRVGVDDGESVIIKKRGKMKKFEVTMLSAPITGLGVKLKHD
jgi:hypothetical protein